jgi:flagellar FliL protein
MSSVAKAPVAEEAGAEAGEEPAKKKSPLMLIVAGVVALLVIIGAGLWFTGILPKLLGMGPKAAGKMAQHDPAVPDTPTYLDVPEIITNLNVPGRRQSYLKLHAKLELGSAADVAAATAAMPRILDLFQTYLRDMRPDELRGSEGSYRLREELVGRAMVAVAPAKVRDVLFEEMIIQ